MLNMEFEEKEVDQLRNILLHHQHDFVRRKALSIVLKSYKIPHSEIAKIVGISENTLRGYLKAYGKKKLNLFQ